MGVLFQRLFGFFQGKEYASAYVVFGELVRLEVRLYISAKHIEEEQSVGVDSDKNDLCFHRLSAVYDIDVTVQGYRRK